MTGGHETWFLARRREVWASWDKHRRLSSRNCLRLWKFLQSHCVILHALHISLHFWNFLAPAMAKKKKKPNLLTLLEEPIRQMKSTLRRRPRCISGSGDSRQIRLKVKSVGFLRLRRRTYKLRDERDKRANGFLDITEHVKGHYSGIDPEAGLKKKIQAGCQRAPGYEMDAI